mgnify:FL=1
MKPNEAAEKQEIMYRLKNAGELYVLLSMCTGEPYVVCDQETYDDEIIVFFDSQAAVEEAKEQTEAGTPVRPMKLENKQFLIFYTSLYTLGVNALLVKDGGRNSLIQLQDFVKRNKQQGQETGEKVWVENPSLHLTMLYYMQELRRKPGQENLPQIKEWQDEISNDFGKGSFIVPVEKEGKGLAAVKVNEQLFQAIFTDILEFQRFNREGKLRPLVVTADKIPQIMTEEAKGVILNPMGVRMPLQIKRTAGQTKQNA